MPYVHRKITTLFINWWAWIADYTYVVYWQIHDFIFKNDPLFYSTDKDSSFTKTPILLIPGVYENWQFMKPVADLLHKNDHPIYIADGIGYNTGDVEKMAELVNDFIEASTIESCIIVAHSKGGLIGKLLLSDFNGHKKIKGMIALNTPFSGSLYAYALPFKSIQVFKPNSPILSRLNKNTIVNKNIISIYGQFDPHIPKGSYLEGAQNIQLNTRGHFRIMNDADVHVAILDGIDTLLPLS